MSLPGYIVGRAKVKNAAKVSQPIWKLVLISPDLEGVPATLRRKTVKNGWLTLQSCAEDGQTNAGLQRCPNPQDSPVTGMNANSQQADQRSGRPSCRRVCSWFAAALFLAASLSWAGAARAAEPFDAFLENHCIGYHGPEKEKGDLRIDRLSRDFKLGADTHHWAEMMEQVNSGEMPPKKEKRPTQEEISVFVTSLDSRIKEGRAARMAARIL